MKKIAIALAFIMLLTTPTFAAEPTAAVTPTGIPLSEVGDRINEIVATYMHEYTVGLAVAVIHNGEIIFMDGYGYADISRDMAVDAETTVFSLASISKLFVYTSVMQLAERGLLDLDEVITSPYFSFRYNFTMRDVLNHSAGFADNNFNEAWGFTGSVFSVAQGISLRDGLLATQPVQLYQPNTATSYSNWGTAFAAYIVSQISGMEYAGFERANILDVLGMTNTRNQPHWSVMDINWETQNFWQNVAQGYAPDGDDGFAETYWIYSNLYPKGSMKSTVADLAQFAIALMPPPGELSPLFESRTTLDLMLSPSYTAPLRGTHHGFVSYDAVLPAVGHSGGHPGFNTEFVIVPGKRFAIITLTNAMGGMRLSEKILDLVLGNTMGDVPPSPANLPDARTVEGTFIVNRRNIGNLIEPANPMLGVTLTVEAVDENTITLTQGLPPLPGAEGEDIIITFRQVAPYVFRAVDANTTLARRMARDMNEIEFIIENGQPIKISTSSVTDAAALTFWQSMAALVLGMVVTYGIFLFFVIASIAALIRFLRRKEAYTMFQHLSNGILLCGVLFGLNTIILDARLIGAMHSGIHSYMFAPHIWLNYALLLAVIVLIVISAIMRDKTRKLLYFSSIAALAVYVIFLWHWNFFVLL